MRFLLLLISANIKVDITLIMGCEGKGLKRLPLVAWNFWHLMSFELPLDYRKLSPSLRKVNRKTCSRKVFEASIRKKALARDKQTRRQASSHSLQVLHSTHSSFTYGIENILITSKSIVYVTCPQLNARTLESRKRNDTKKVTALVIKQHFCRFELMFDFNLIKCEAMFDWLMNGPDGAWCCYYVLDLIFQFFLPLDWSRPRHVLWCVLINQKLFGTFTWLRPSPSQLTCSHSYFWGFSINWHVWNTSWLGLPFHSMSCWISLPHKGNSDQAKKAKRSRRWIESSWTERNVCGRAIKVALLDITREGRLCLFAYLSFFL